MAGKEEGARRNQENTGQRSEKMKWDPISTQISAVDYKETSITSNFCSYIRNKNCHFHNNAFSKVTLNMTH